MITSPCVALEVRAEEAVATFRQTAGPWDVEMAKELRPGTLRAIYGQDRVRSGVHCTELEGDGAAECRYFFELLQS
jgi:nucleoside-diphosphate kinase